MADEPENKAPGSVKVEMDLQSPTADPHGNALTGDPPGKGRIHRRKLSLRYRPQTLKIEL